MKDGGEFQRENEKREQPNEVKSKAKHDRKDNSDISETRPKYLYRTDLSSMSKVSCGSVDDGAGGDEQYEPHE